MYSFIYVFFFFLGGGILYMYINGGGIIDVYKFSKDALN